MRGILVHCSMSQDGEPMRNNSQQHATTFNWVCKRTQRRNIQQFCVSLHGRGLSSPRIKTNNSLNRKSVINWGIGKLALLSAKSVLWTFAISCDSATPWELHVMLRLPTTKQHQLINAQLVFGQNLLVVYLLGVVTISAFRCNVYFPQSTKHCVFFLFNLIPDSKTYCCPIFLRFSFWGSNT